MITAIQDAVRLLLPAKRKTNSVTGWISFDAPCCETRGLTQRRSQRGGMVLSPDGVIGYHCFNCGFITGFQPGRHLTFKFRKLLEWMGADENTIQRLVIDAIRIKELVPPEQIVDAKETEPVTFKARPLPDEAQDFFALNSFYTLNNDRDVPQGYHNAVLYTSTRKIDLQKYPFYWTPEKQYNLNRRVIIPFTWRNEIIGYTARAVDDTVKPKYHSNYEPNYVFNVDRQRPDAKFVIVVEGPFDAMSIDGVAVLSNECSRVQADIIDDLDREVIVVPDVDKAGAKLVDQAILYGWTVSFPIWQETHKDVASAVEEYGKLFVIKSILEARQTNKLKIELHKKKLYN
jgi:hypothetical protein